MPFDPSSHSVHRRMGRRAEHRVGTATRGTTNTNRLRRIDRWIGAQPALLHATDPYVVDLGYGASGVTTLELATRLAHARPDVDVLGLEIDPARVRTAQEQLARVRTGDSTFPPGVRLDFALGGFEVPTPGGRRPAVIRAFSNTTRSRVIEFGVLSPDPGGQRPIGQSSPSSRADPPGEGGTAPGMPG